nr:hypothetical protein L204_06511 [Cryptococcus depauperatus CBS 7855]
MRMSESQFLYFDKVFLNAKNITSLRPSAKLDQKFLGPFTIIGTTPSPLSFKLDLPASMNVLILTREFLIHLPVSNPHPRVSNSLASF